MSTETPRLDFIRARVKEDLEAGKNEGKVITRFPPEPNGYLHIGHAKAIVLNFGIANEFGGRCHLRLDDTNPEKETVEFCEAIKDDVRWLGFDWGEHEYYASDYYEQLYAWAVALIKAGHAYVDSLSPEEIREKRGTPMKKGENSPYRDRTPAENLDLFERMRNGEFEEGACVLRAKIDMGHANFNMRDPVLYRIMKVPHYRAGDKWCIYPMYDFAHGESDWLEGITHSVCTLEFENHRPLYDWFVDTLAAIGEGPKGISYRPRQIEFARLNLNYTVMSKRKLLDLVRENRVSGWDDPRMPTLRGLRRRGFTPEAIRNFCERIGIAKFNSTVDVGLLEFCVREDLNKRAERRMAVLDPLKVTIENYPEGGEADELDAVNNPEDAAAGTRKIRFSREIFIERDDFREDAPKKFHRLAPGKEVRLRYAYFITCKDVVKNAAGDITELICTYDPASRGGNSPDGRKVKGTIHWVSAEHAVPAEVRLYDRLFTSENPGEDGRDYRDEINPNSLVTVTGYVEPALKGAAAGTTFQFERLGYFCADKDSTPERPVFNRTVPLKDSWSKIESKDGE